MSQETGLGTQLYLETKLTLRKSTRSTYIYSQKHFRSSTEFPTQNLRQIG